MNKEILILQSKKESQKNRKMNYNGVDYIQTMMMWATQHMDKEEIMDIIKGADGKATGIDRLQREIQELEIIIQQKRKEFLKKLMALYFMKPDKNPVNNSLIEFNEWINSISRRYG
jgi:hypothetical protein